MKKKQGGFSLIEIIISIAAIALASSIILQLFLVASYRNDRGKRTDMSVLYVQSMLEAFKRGGKPEDVFETLLPGKWEEKQGGYRAEANFSDDAFTSLSSGKALYHVEAVLMPKQTGHDTALPLNFDGTGGNISTSIYRLSIRVSMYRNDGTEDELLTMGVDNLFTVLEASQ